MCDYVKCEVDGSPESYRNIEQVAQAVNLRKCRLIAEKVETQEIFERARQLGCTLFQGFFFARPKVMASKIISPLRMNQLRLLGEINSKNSDFDKLANIIKNDIALTYKTLRLVNSAYFGLQHEITGVNQAVAFLGLHQMKRWLTVSSLTTLCEEKPPELVVMSLVRAHFCEQVAKKTRRGRDSEAYFLAGLFSLLDTLTDTDLPTCLEKMTVPTITQRALLEEDNPGRTMLDLIVSLEYGSWTWVENYSEALGLDVDKVSDIYVEALEAAHNLL